MGTLKAIVQDGHLTLREPTDLPEGEVVELVEVDQFEHLDGRDDLDDEERARLHEAINRGRAELDAGLGVPAEEFVKELETL